MLINDRSQNLWLAPDPHRKDPARTPVALGLLAFDLIVRLTRLFGMSIVQGLRCSQPGCPVDLRICI